MATSNESAPDTERDTGPVSADTDPELDVDFDRVECEPVRIPARERLRTLRGIGPSSAEEDEDDVPATMPVLTFESLSEPEQATLPQLSAPEASAPPPPPPRTIPPPPPRTPPPPPPSRSARPRKARLAQALPPLHVSLPPPQAASLPPTPHAALPAPLLPAPAPRIHLPSIPPLRPPPTPKGRGGVASTAAVYRAIATSRPPPKAPLPEPKATVGPVGGSVAPVALATLRPPEPPAEPTPKRRRSRRKAAAVGVLAGALVALGAFWSLRNMESATVAAVNAVADDGSSIHDVRILVDGVERCASSPCTVTGLARGSHLASAVASGYVPTAARAFTVQAGQPVNVGFELVRVPPAPEQSASAATEQSNAPNAAAVAAATEQSDTAAVDADPAPALPKRASARKGKQSSAPRLAQAAAAKVKPTTSQATLSFQSAPSANVVLDGRPIGKTPLAGVSVTPGAHSIVFIGADGRRKTQTANVTAGSKRSIVAKF